MKRYLPAAILAVMVSTAAAAELRGQAVACESKAMLESYLEQKAENPAYALSGEEARNCIFLKDGESIPAEVKGKSMFGLGSIATIEVDVPGHLSTMYAHEENLVTGE